MYQHHKQKKQLKNEKILAKLHGQIRLFCDNERCPNTIHVRKDEAKRTYWCTKCNAGMLTKKKPKKKSERPKKSTPEQRR